MSIVTCRSHRARRLGLGSGAPVSTEMCHYIGGLSGQWRLTQQLALAGQPLKPVTHLDIVQGNCDRPRAGTAWVCRAFASQTRYITREKPSSHEQTCVNHGSEDDHPAAALILIRRSRDWWRLHRDERRDLETERSPIVAPRMRFLWTIARQFGKAGDLDEPFDALTWFEFTRRDEAIFDDLIGAMRASKEWDYVDREIEIRLERE